MSTVVSTLSGSPTKPRSTTFSMFEPGSTTVRVTLRACTMLPSLPHSPTARPPAALMKPTICLLIEPASTISTISIVALSVMRRPSANSDLMPSRLSMSPDLRPAAVHHDRIDRGLLHQHDVAREALRRRLVAHRVAAVFHHDDLLVVLLHVRQRLDEDAGLVLRRNGHCAIPVFAGRF